MLRPPTARGQLPILHSAPSLRQRYNYFSPFRIELGRSLRFAATLSSAQKYPWRCRDRRARTPVFSEPHPQSRATASLSGARRPAPPPWRSLRSETAWDRYETEPRPFLQAYLPWPERQSRFRLRLERLALCCSRTAPLCRRDDCNS